MEVSDYIHAPAALLLEISQLYTKSRTLGWIQSRSVRRGGAKSLSSLSNSNHDSMVVQLTSCPKSNIWYGDYMHIIQNAQRIYVIFAFELTIVIKKKIT